jgi:hypothetical protein
MPVVDWTTSLPDGCRSRGDEGPNGLGRRQARTSTVGNDVFGAVD